MAKTHPPYAAARQDSTLVNVTQLAEFDEVIDVRSESEFAEDHIPGALSCPVLSDAERERVGTIYKQVSAFDAKKIGAALVSRNIARHLERVLPTGHAVGGRSFIAGAAAAAAARWRMYCSRSAGAPGGSTAATKPTGAP